MDSLLVVKTKTAMSQDSLPKNFLNRFGEHVTGIVSGFDRVRFRATLRPLFCPNGPEVYLNYCKVLIKNFKGFAQGISDRVKKLAYETFQQAGRPNIYLPSSELSKEALIQDLVAKDQIKQGPIALLSCVEPCLSFRVRGDRQAKTLRLVMESAKCTHLYHYYQHPEIGLLQKLYPKFIRHAMTTFQSPDVLRFLGRRVPKSSGKVRANFEGEVSSALKERAEGVRIRHTLNGNSLKMYDKEGSVLRVETTIVRPREFRIYRAREGQPKGQKRWRILRKGVCDMYRRGQVCRAANQRYFEALASVTGSNSLLQEAAEVCRPVTRNGKRYRGLNALAQKDYTLLLALSRGEIALNGIRNAELRAFLYPAQATKSHKLEIRRRSAATTRQFALLRAHGLLRKLPRTHRYQLTSKGRRIITALLAACNADVEQLTKMAA
jgi:hypothetical protein